MQKKSPKNIKIVSWNVNSIKARLPNFIEFLKDENPDICLLQELKCVDEAFPFMEVEECGYNIYTHGQKTYNGVAIISKFACEIEHKNLPNFDDASARYIEGVVSLEGGAIRVASVYVPNGQEVGSDKFQYKMRFFDALREHCRENINHLDEAFFLGGDFNVANYDIDVFDPKSLAGSVCFHPDEQAKFRDILMEGYVDSFRALNEDKQVFSWWDYRGNAWGFNKGMRIDYILTNPMATDMLKGASISTKFRSQEKASDHAPVVAEIEI